MTAKRTESPVRHRHAPRPQPAWSAAGIQVCADSRRGARSRPENPQSWRPRQTVTATGTAGPPNHSNADPATRPRSSPKPSTRRLSAISPDRVAHYAEAMFNPLRHMANTRLPRGLPQSNVVAGITVELRACGRRKFERGAENGRHPTRRESAPGQPEDRDVPRAAIRGEEAGQHGQARQFAEWPAGLRRASGVGVQDHAARGGVGDETPCLVNDLGLGEGGATAAVDHGCLAPK